MRKALVLVLGLVAGCGGPHRTPPASLWFDGLPVSGRLADARKAGFSDCTEGTDAMRCSRGGVMLLGHGPYNAAVDLDGSDGGGGFDQLTLWHDTDQDAFLASTADLERQGWRTCYTGEGSRGDQAIYTRKGAPVKISMDISYWGKRRLRVLPAGSAPAKGC